MDNPYSSRRNFLRTALSTGLVGLVTNCSAAQGPPKPPMSHEEIEILRRRRTSDEYSKQVDKLYQDYESILKRKGKYNPGKKHELRINNYPRDIDAGKRLETMKSYVLIEENPKKYLETLEEEEKDKIKNMTLTKEQKDQYKKVFSYMNLDPNNLDLSDRIRIYLYEKGELPKSFERVKKEAAEDISRGIVNPTIRLIENLFKQ
ncbi:hypothetical protein J4218_04640 [Candidatus Pacearchaeota archaeon]|nr:hypothetical protein [Candidatus Pacearchaeota archaeon]